MAKSEILKRVLIEHNVDKDIINTINNGYEDVNNKSTKKKKAEYLFHAVNEMDKSLDKDTCQDILEECACTIGSSLEKNHVFLY
jgi:hemerythrin-like domain-containing protein